MVEDLYIKLCRAKVSLKVFIDLLWKQLFGYIRDILYCSDVTKEIYKMTFVVVIDYSLYSGKEDLGLFEISL